MRKARNIFWIVFALSILFIFGLGSLITFTTGTPEGPESSREDIVIWVPLVTAIISLIGGVVTTIGTFRKDRLEARKAELELEEHRFELEKKRLDAEIEIAKKQRELDELRKNDQHGGG
jgi:hypothetical protein